MPSEEAHAAVEKMQRFIATNLDKRITLAELARAGNYSQSHAARVFKVLTGKNPFDYIRSLRMTEAARRLRDGSQKIIDIALDFVFDTHEGFTRSFTKEFGINPRAYKKNPVPLQYFIPWSVLSRYHYYNKGDRIMEREVKEKTDNKTRTVFVQVIERPKRLAIIKRGIKATDYFSYCGEVGCEIWGILESIKEAMFEPAGFWLPDKLVKPNTSRYVQGVEVAASYSGTVPEGFDLIELEPCKFLVFQGEPYEDENFEEAISEVWEAISKYNPEPFGYRLALNMAPRFQLAPMGYRGYIEAVPVENLTVQAKP